MTETGIHCDKVDKILNDFLIQGIILMAGQFR